MAALELSFASGERSLSVRRFAVEEQMSGLFNVVIEARSPQEDLDLEEIVGKPASLRIITGVKLALVGSRSWTGICSAMEQTAVETSGLSTYELTIVPALWLLGQRRNNRLFQHQSLPDIVATLLAEWHIEALWKIDRSRYPRVELRVQYGESDLAFFDRLLEEAGISYSFVDDADKGTQLVLHDEPERADVRPGGPLPFVDSPSQAQAAEIEFLTAVRVGHEVRPGRMTLRDHDFRRPAFPLFSEAEASPAPEDRYEQYHYRPGAFLVEASSGAPSVKTSAALLEAAKAGLTPVADDLGVARFDQASGTTRAENALLAARASKRLVRFGTNVIDLAPGVLFSVRDHARSDLAPDRRLMVIRSTLEGTASGEWTMGGRALFADLPHRPLQKTPKPIIHGVQCATVVGPSGEEIYTDEFGRVRVQFPWDREGKFDERSSIWMRVSQGWAGPGQGVFTIPRVGHEVLVAFLDGDPDAPLVVGRVFNGMSQVPYKLPDNKTVSTWKSASSPGEGGFNEIRFEDQRGREHVYLQAEKDLDTLVKHDEMSAVGHNRTRVVKHDETVSIGHDRTEVVQFNQLETTGLNHSSTVGINRNSTVGADDTTLVGSKWSVTMARGLTGRLARELGDLMSGPLGPILAGPVSAVLGKIPMGPLGGPGLSGMLRGPLSLLHTLAPESFRSVLQVMEGFTVDAGPPPTTIEMVDRKITLTTGEASIILDGPNITFMADGNITHHARKNAAVLADGECAIAAQDDLLVMSKKGQLIAQGGPFLHLNPQQGEGAAIDERYEASAADDAQVCEECGAPLIRKRGLDGTFSMVCDRVREKVPGSPLAPFSLEEAMAYSDDERSGGVA